MVAGHYQPLADDGSHVLHGRPTKPVLCSRVRRQRGEDSKENPLVFAPSMPNEEGEPADDDKWGRRPRNSTT
jgi:hypothetical protein